jgi:enamine deaminase RidA (YjgF/YER057c/UK114 family)
VSPQAASGRTLLAAAIKKMECVVFLKNFVKKQITTNHFFLS